MYISAVKIENFRTFGEGISGFSLALRQGLTAIVGENDAGKTAFVDALRLVLGTRDQDTLRIDATDFHHPPQTARSTEIRIRLVFSELTSTDRHAFAEYLTYGSAAGSKPDLIVTWVAKRVESDGVGRRFTPVEWRTGANADGPLLDAGARFQLQVTYLRPLRDAERAMAAGRGSRLAQILQHTKEIKDHGKRFDVETLATLDPNSLSVLGLGDYANHLIETSQGIKTTRQKLNDDYLKPLSFSTDPLAARVRINGHREDAVRLRQLLEKLEVSLAHDELAEDAHTRGLGSNNILFMACELLLLGTEAGGFPLLLIEEPEAHLHPQRQLRLMAFLQAQAEVVRPDGQRIQIIVTTHSPNLASDIKLDNLVLIRNGRAFSMAQGETKLTKSDYRFLQRFLDVTKSNLFFARGVMIVEGDAENILLPVIATLVGRDFGEYGVSVVNVGGVGLSRYGRIFLREQPQVDGEHGIRVACVTDMDVMPDCAALILGKIKDGEAVPDIGSSPRRWRVEGDYTETTYKKRRDDIRQKAHGPAVETFVADKWTLEYDLAHSGLAKAVYVAIALAEADDRICEGKVTLKVIAAEASTSFDVLLAKQMPKDALCTTIYAPLTGSNSISKTIVAQYLSEILSNWFTLPKGGPKELWQALPDYIRRAIEHVTEPVVEAEMATVAAVADDPFPVPDSAPSTDRP
ncbi:MULTISPECIES: ATP-dependent nuclease [Rhizobium]|uniref:ATP-dependent nuclease n=1 Tax=Rhizobium TaxID=379 RepID=UPI000374869E|nr:MULTISPECIES: AAA family ATPase [Rhizobium]AVC45672.1 AAA domain protein [Rhizobium leguminosarum bv. viciae]MBX5159618.1 AAA family ATPase [Rhizobium sp. NZLR8]TCA84440.1 DUF2813 domain-containing protein [Rhizobium leguminosarum bv. viciae]TCA94673.1 DUF2813 domain-containing protein [Rhizobium leguminosarum bv. viciae]